MENVLVDHRLGEPLPERLAIVRALPGLGDMLCIVPAMRALRAALPKAHVTLIGLPQARDFAQRFRAYLDDFIEFPGYPGIAERTPIVHQLPGFFTGAHQRDFDLALQMHGSGITTNPFTVLLGAGRNAGLYLPGQYCPDEERFLPYPAHEPEPWRFLRLIQFLGIPLQGDELEFPLDDGDGQSLRAIDAAHELAPGQYVCIHPGASYPARRWSPQRFAAVADNLARRGLRIVLTGTAAEQEITAAVSQAMNHHAIDLAGHTGLGALAALLSGARLLVCNDTGVSHLAAALAVPSVVIFLVTDPNRWAPADGQRHRVAGRPILQNVDHDCGADRRCLRDGCHRLTSSAAPATVSVAEVLAQVEALLWPEDRHYKEERDAA